jgi:cellulose synthase/poly-beta-1,6-N-acetylglucosamine synthase-like glycosyltransferase
MMVQRQARSTADARSVRPDRKTSLGYAIWHDAAPALPRVSVVIPAYNAEATISECVSRVFESSYEAVEVILVDDGSTDETLALAKRFPVRVVRSKGRLRAAAARNLGARAATGDLLFFIDTDVMLRPDSIERLVGRFGAGDVDAICGVQSAEMRHRGLASQYKNLWMRWTYLRAQGEVPLFCATAAAIRCSAFWQAQGFDLNYTTSSLEDTAFGQKLARLGIRVRVQPDLEVEHVKQYSLASLLRTDFQRAVALLRLKLRHRSELGSNNTSVPTSYIASIPLAGLGTLALLAGLVIGLPLLCLVGVLALVGILLLNRDFLHTIRVHEGWPRALASAGLLWLDLLVAGLGSGFGLLSFPFDNRN